MRIQVKGIVSQDLKVYFVSQLNPVWAYYYSLISFILIPKRKNFDGSAFWVDSKLNVSARVPARHARFF
jgi:hypothetical protein